jgi:UV DNA damage endonuclease
MTLGSGKNKITTNRSMIKKTFLERGIPYASELGLLNAKDLLPILKWNVAHCIFLFRLSSDFFPWASEYELEDLPDFEEIKSTLAEAGQYAKQNGIRIT